MTEIVEVRTKEVLVVHGTSTQLIAERTTRELLEVAQQGPEATWLIPHPLNKVPSVTVIDSSG